MHACTSIFILVHCIPALLGPGAYSGSYLTTTFVIEAMASANALVHWKTLQHYKRVVDEEESTITQAKQEDMVVSHLFAQLLQYQYTAFSTE